MLRIEIYAMAPKIKSITEAIDLIKVQTYNCIDTSNNSILFTRLNRIKNKTNLQLFLNTKIIYLIKNNISIAFYFLYVQSKLIEI